jgi:large subunit ribosomal protein L10
MMTRAEKDVVIKDLKEKIESARALFVTNLIGISANDAVEIRKKVRDAKGAVVVTKNTLFGKAAEGTYAEEILSGLKGTNAVAFAFEDAPGVAKALFEASKELEPITLGAGF